MNTSSYPSHATITEVGMRDGFQFESTPIPTALKLEVLHGLVAAGIQRIQVTSFVHPKWVPQMADAEELVANLPDNTSTVFTGLALNARGVERAAKTGLRHVDLSISTNNQHSLDNANMSREDAIQQALEMVALARDAGMEAQMGFQCVFGYATPGDTPIELILDMTRQFVSQGIESLSLADSTGMANPTLMASTLKAVAACAEGIPIVLHLHDTRGLGLANVVAALQCGVSHFDTSIGGLGGCPFIPGATGNIATEDTAYLLESLGINTGIDTAAVAQVTQSVAAHLGRNLPGKLYNLATREG
ncbi:MAG: hydroxymethylglutaryl-CoA lyase [Bacteroidota bacterium]